MSYRGCFNENLTLLTKANFSCFSSKKEKKYKKPYYTRNAENTQEAFTEEAGVLTWLDCFGTQLNWRNVNLGCIYTTLQFRVWTDPTELRQMFQLRLLVFESLRFCASFF